MNLDDFERDVDDLLADLHKIIDEEETPPVSTPTVAAELGLDLDEIYEAPAPAPEPEPEPEKTHTYWTQTQRLPRHVAKLQKDQEKAYAEWLYAQGGEQPAPTPTPRRPVPVQDHWEEEEPELPKKKPRHGFRNFVLTLLVLALLVLAATVFLLPKRPDGAGLSGRKDGVTTILLAGTDQGGARTDTLMLLTADRPNKTLSLVSIPRDTLVNGSYTVPKINSVYGANNGGEEGIEMLMTRVAQCIGYEPDGYMLIRLDAFVELVDAMGGVTFDVPVDMFYNDPAQDLYIDLKAGQQTLTGEQAMGVVRFRSGYADADLGRVQVQRDLLSALMDQVVGVEGIARSPQLLQILMEHTDSDLTVSNYLWLAETALLADLSDIPTATLPGTARTISGGSYYVLDPEAVAQTVNAYCNPLDREITADDLEIRTN